MNSQADVRSIEAIRSFLRELKRYTLALRNIQESLQVESRKAEDWIEQDRTRYWPRAAKQAEDRLTEARNQLLRCKMAALEGQPKSCADEKKAVEQALARLRHCESQVRVVRHWRQRFRHHLEEFSGRMARLSQCSDNDLPKALAALERIIDALEKYATPAGDPPPPRGTPATRAETDAAAPPGAGPDKPPQPGNRHHRQEPSP